MSHFVYILLCADDTLYTGYTTNIKERENKHNGIGDTESSKKLGAKYTRARRPVKLVYSEEFSTRSEAMKRECAIKKLSRQEKLKLIESK